MSVCIKQLATKFYIPAENKESALQAIKSMQSDGPFPWIDYKVISRDQQGNPTQIKHEFLDATSLDAALEMWNWYPETDTAGNVVGLTFLGSKHDAYDQLFQTISPFVKPGSFIDVLYEWGSIIRYCFDGQQMKEDLLVGGCGYVPSLIFFDNFVGADTQELCEGSVTSELGDTVNIQIAKLDDGLEFVYSPKEVDDQHSIRLPNHNVLVVAKKADDYQFYYCPWDGEIDGHLPVYFMGSFNQNSPHED